MAYNTGAALTRCLDSLEAQEGVDLEILVVDNGGGGQEIDDADARPGVTLVDPGANLGFAAGCNLGAARTSGEVLLFLNPDTVVVEGAVAELGRTLEDAAIGIAMGRLLLYAEPDKLNSAGAAIHISGLAWSSRYGEPAASVTTEREVTYANGSALAIRRELFEQLGGFTEELFAYHEDLELGWRARMRGLRIVLNPKADVLHDYEHSRNPAKYYLMERNRLVFVFSAYSTRLLALLAPLLVAAEVGLTLVALRERWFRDKARGWRWCLANVRWIAAHRRRLQSERLVRDRDLAGYLTPTVDALMIELPSFIRWVNPVLVGYWGLVRKLL